MSDPFAVRSDDHVYGDPAAAVTVLEYGDFQCPYCAAAAPVLQTLVDESRGGVRLVFRNWPLPDVHPYALTAALAAEAAADQGRYWEMHHLLFRRQDHLADADLVRYGEELGLDTVRLVGEAAQPYGDKVEADFATGVALGVPGTPTVYLDGQLFSGRPDLRALRRAIGAASEPGGQPGAGRQRRGLLRRRRAQREALAEGAQQDGAEDRCGQ
ncbi:DsbA family protein [Klenkia taihuensis]|uniref:Thioredoxin n=1 Tax=Klenkia taihuensis TaxID=1225127 RepID=A0A1I1K6S6_9ACTN|nr:DsbA family protein [Klenkia taihuensis]SFC56697.1 Thioredoxin [Klenkia taihuensis]